MFTKVLYGAAALGLLVSVCRNKQKTKLALKKAWKSFENILPPVLAILLLTGLILSVLDPATVSRLLGSESGVLGMVIAAAVGCVTLMPGFVAFPLAASLLQAGAGYGQIAMFVSTLMMVGVATLPVESAYFGRRTAVKRNVLCLLLSVLTSCVIGGLLG